MPSPNRRTSSFSTDQAVAAASLLRSLTSRLHSLPGPEAESLAQTLLAPAGLVHDLRVLVEAATARAGITSPPGEGPLPELRHHPADVDQRPAGRPAPVRRLPSRSSSPGTRGLPHPTASVAPE